MSTTIITLAADHVSGLLVQGLPLDDALEHARLRFGVSRDLILAEINARHAFALAAADANDVMDDFFTFDAAQRWADEGGQ